MTVSFLEMMGANSHPTTATLAQPERGNCEGVPVTAVGQSPTQLDAAEVALDRRIREVGGLMEASHNRGDRDQAHRYWLEMRSLIQSRTPEHVWKLERARGIGPRE